MGCVPVHHPLYINSTAVYYIYIYIGREREGRGRREGGGGRDGEGGRREGISDKSYDTNSMQDGLLWIAVQMLQAKI